MEKTECYRVVEVKEFGSDFHYLQPGESAVRSIRSFYSNAVYYAAGRHALIDLYGQMNWKRLWIPKYFCYDVLESLARLGLNVEFYDDFPLNDDRDEVCGLPFQKGDALLRVNYFGLRARRSNKEIPVPVVEDHTHDLIGDWAANSDADWCIASLRKTLPLAEGGILWSPKGHTNPSEPNLTECNSELAAIRWDAMRNKTMYLEDRIADKSMFRTDMVATEEQFDTLEISALDVETAEYISKFDVLSWYHTKRSNWTLFRGNKNNNFIVLEPEGSACNPFSLTILFGSEKERNRYRQSLIDNNVYPAILFFEKNVVNSL